MLASETPQLDGPMLEAELARLLFSPETPRRPDSKTAQFEDPHGPKSAPLLSTFAALAGRGAGEEDS